MTTRKTTNAGLRKAAILVASLDQAAADAVLEQLTPEQARHVRRLAVELERHRPAGAAADHRRVFPHRAAAARPVPPGHRVGRRPGAAAGPAAGGRRLSPAGGGAAGERAVSFPPRGGERQALPPLGRRAAADHCPGALPLAAAAGRQRVGAVAAGLAGRGGPPAGRSGRDGPGDSPRGGRGPPVAAFRAGADAASPGGRTGRRGRHPPGRRRPDRHADPRQPGRPRPEPGRAAPPPTAGLRRPGRRRRARAGRGGPRGRPERVADGLDRGGAGVGRAHAGRVAGGGGRPRPPRTRPARVRSACATWKRPAGRSPAWPSAKCPAGKSTRNH